MQIGIIGFGQIGGRHLQSMLKLNYPLNIFLVDENADVFNKVSSLSAQIGLDYKIQSTNLITVKSHNIYYLSSIKNLPALLDFVIISTTASKRLESLKELVKAREIKCLVLEKVLFTHLPDYHEAQKIIQNNKITTYVNCNLRAIDFYQEVKNRNDFHLINHMKVTGKSWGLGCNLIHFVDLFTYYFGNINRDKDEIDCAIDKIFPSKRAGYIEFNGEVHIKNNQASFYASSTDDATEILKIELSGNQLEVTFTYEPDAVEISIKKFDEVESCHRKHLPLQSNLTQQYISSFLNNEILPLPTYEESMGIHLIIINDFIKKLESKGIICGDTCPIT